MILMPPFSLFTCLRLPSVLRVDVDKRKFAVFVLPTTPYPIRTVPQFTLTDLGFARLGFAIAPRVETDWKGSPHQITKCFHRVGHQTFGSPDLHLGIVERPASVLNARLHLCFISAPCSFSSFPLRVRSKADRDGLKLLSIHLSSTSLPLISEHRLCCALMHDGQRLKEDLTPARSRAFSACSVVV